MFSKGHESAPEGNNIDPASYMAAKKELREEPTQSY